MPRLADERELGDVPELGQNGVEEATRENRGAEVADALGVDGLEAVRRDTGLDGQAGGEALAHVSALLSRDGLQRRAFIGLEPAAEGGIGAALRRPVGKERALAAQLHVGHAELLAEAGGRVGQSRLGRGVAGENPAVNEEADGGQGMPEQRTLDLD